MQHESSSLSPIKYRDQEQLVDEVRTMVKKSKEKTSAGASEQVDGRKKGRAKGDGCSPSSASTSFLMPRTEPQSQIHSRSFNQKLPA